MKFSFGKISEINMHDESSWKNKIFITLDIDWAPDFMIRKIHAHLKKAGVVSTWFVTHHSEAINELAQDENVELGIHPNFNPLLLHGSLEKGNNAEEVLDDLMKWVPQASSIRSHSLTQNSGLLNVIRAKSFTHECNMFIPYNAGITLRPFLHWNGLIRIPHFWEDDVAAIYGDDLNDTFDHICKHGDLKVLGFHPIHLYLNTHKLDNYNLVKQNMDNVELVNENINHSEMGAMDFLNKFIN